ncbi:MAG: cofactor-independent phosphoglycerate mutase [Methanoculleaceae archaeon]
MASGDRPVVIILGDGMADVPLEELGGRTPLEYAQTPAMDRVAGEGVCGRLRTVPPGMDPGSDIANLSVLGYDPRTCYTGRGPLEAMNMGIPLDNGEVAYRCNLITEENGRMTDFTAGHISSREGALLLESLAGALPDGVSVHPGISYRNLLVVAGGEGADTTPPHDIVGEEIAPYLPRGPDAPILLRCMEISREVFADHTVNSARIAAGLPPATGVWPWSGGKKPSLEPFLEKYGRRGGMISAVDLMNGIARCAGMEVIHVHGATGFLDTDYDAKAEAAVRALDHLGFVYVHVEAPDEAGHMGDVREKVRAIERLDDMVETVLTESNAVVAVLPDHPTPIPLRTHTTDPVPFAVAGIGSDGCERFSEKEASQRPLMEALDFLRYIFNRL